MIGPLLSAVLLLLGVFVVPYRFPPSQHVLSASALAGYNNSLAYVLYALSLIAAALVYGPRVPGPEVFGRYLSTAPLLRLPSRVVLAVLAGHVLLFVAIYLRQHGFFLAESLYFEDTVYRTQAGAVPFVDFAFFYGPLLLYPAVWCADALGLIPGYAVCFVLSYLLSLYFLYVILGTLIENRRHLDGCFVLLSVGLFNPYLGLNYTLLRFTLPAMTVLAAWRYYQGRSIGQWVTAVGLATMALLCSPDIAVVSVAAVGVMGVVTLWSRRPESLRPAAVLAVFGVPLAAVVLSILLLFGVDGSWRPAMAYLGPVVTFAAGGWNTQIDPSLPILTLFGFTILVVAWLWRSWQASPVAEARPVAAAYAVMLLLMQRASFGKADVVHVAYSGLPVFLAAAAWAAQAPRRRQWQMAALFVAGVVLPLQFYHAMLFVPSVAQRWASAPTMGASSLTTPPASKLQIQGSLTTAVEHFGRDRLFYMHRLEYYRLPVYQAYGLKPFMYQPTLAAAFTAEDIGLVIDQLRNSPAVVLARRADLSQEAPRFYETHWPFYVTSSPLPGSTVFNLTLDFQSRLERPLVEFLTTAYRVDFEDGDIVGLVPQSARPPASHALQ